MFDIFQNTTRPNRDLFFHKNDVNDRRLGEIILPAEYDDSDVVILGCPQDEGVRRSGGRTGAALAPAAIRRQFYKLTDFGINRKIFDLGDTIIRKTLEETHENQTAIVEQILLAGKKLIILGGGNDISFADGAAMSKIYGGENWTALNIDAHFDVRVDCPRNSGTPYRQLLDGKFIAPANFYEIAFQTSAASPVYYEFLKSIGVNLISLEAFQSSKNIFRGSFNDQLPIFWGFDVDAVRAADAPGVSAPSPIGLTAEEFCSLAATAGSSGNTKIIEFCEVNPNYDIDNRTARLVAVAMHKFICAIK
ncbi:MAG: formimidoylglutamase [Pyrinomonadaceae bacterium]|nr:formimidoylglutamase [Pyrinomonadaceae bacterium]